MFVVTKASDVKGQFGDFNSLTVGWQSGSLAKGSKDDHHQRSHAELQ